MKYIPYGHQSIDEEDINAVVQVLKSDWLTQGPNIEFFEKALCAYTSAKFAVAVANATAALHLSCIALGLTSEDYLWTSPITFVASANCGLYCNAKVDFVDIELDTYNIDVDVLEEKLVFAEKNGKLPKIVVVVHFAGHSCKMEAIKKLSMRFGFYIIEDASHAVGGEYNNVKVGASVYSDITIFSFHPVKIITTGEGGAALTNNVELYDKLKKLRTHGITKNVNEFVNVADGPWYYEQVDLGYNYRMTDFQAALGANQLKKTDRFVQKRQEIFAYYVRSFAKYDIKLPTIRDNVVSALHLFPILVDAKRRREIFEELLRLNIGVNVHYIPVYKQPYYQRLGFPKCYCPNADQYYACTISLPIYASLPEEALAFVVRSLSTFYECNVAV